MKTKPGQTPTPLRVDKENPSLIRDAEGFLVCKVVDDITAEMGPRIIRAVNAHAALLHAAKEAAEMFEAMTGEKEADDRTEHIMDELADAIAKAEGRS